MNGETELIAYPFIEFDRKHTASPIVSIVHQAAGAWHHAGDVNCDLLHLTVVIASSTMFHVLLISHCDVSRTCDTFALDFVVVVSIDDLSTLPRSKSLQCY